MRRESYAEDHVPNGHYARMSSQKNSEVTHKREVEDQGMEHHDKSTSAPQNQFVAIFRSTTVVILVSVRTPCCSC